MNMDYHSSQPETIQSMFNDIASKYDKANQYISLGMYNHWNQALVNHTINRKKPEVFLDLCCGTGEVAFAYLKQQKQKKTAYLLDFSENMLFCAKEKAKQFRFSHDVQFLQADAQYIPLSDENVDCSTISYGIRNVKDPKKCAEEVFRVLKPGGTFGILELTRPSQPILKEVYKLYLKYCLPKLGKYVTDNQKAYEYLCSSVQQFIDSRELISILKHTGFKEVSTKPLFGGIATIFYAKK